jgi:DNA-binding Lrp family transcriptional regulator
MSKPFPTDKRDIDKARFAAIDYVNNLSAAPNGSRITSTEKNVLRALAQFFNATVWFAFPSMRKLAQRCSISVRHCRRTIRSLEGKGVIGRVYMGRDRDGSQASNEYFFIALGAPPENSQAQEARSKLQRIRRIRMTEAVGRKRPREVAEPAPRPRTSSTPSPRHQRPPIESLRESVMDLSHDTRGGIFSAISMQAEMQSEKPEKRIPNKSKNPLDDVNLARMAWNSAIEAIRSEHGAKEFRTHGFLDIRVAHSAIGASGAIVIELRSKQAENAISGIQKFEQTIAGALKRFYGLSVRIVCLGEDEGPSRDSEDANESM